MPSAVVRSFECSNCAIINAPRRAGGGNPLIDLATGLARQHETSSIAAIDVRRDGEYWRVVDVRLAPHMRSAA